MDSEQDQGRIAIKLPSPEQIDPSKKIRFNPAKAPFYTWSKQFFL